MNNVSFANILTVYNMPIPPCFKNIVWKSAIAYRADSYTTTSQTVKCYVFNLHYDVIKWKHLLRYWPFVRGIHRSSVNSPHKGQWWGALMLSLICAWINAWISNREAGDLRRHRAHYDVIVVWPCLCDPFARASAADEWIKTVLHVITLIGNYRPETRGRFGKNVCKNTPFIKKICVIWEHIMP